MPPSTYRIVRKPKSQVYSRVDVRPGDIAQGVNQGHDHKAEDQSNSERSDLTTGNLAKNNRPRPGEDQDECADGFGCTLAGMAEVP